MGRLLLKLLFFVLLSMIEPIETKIQQQRNNRMQAIEEQDIRSDHLCD